MLRQGGACARRAIPNYVTENVPIPHPQHNCRNRALGHNVQANFSKFWRSSLPIRGIRSCGIEALSNLAPHLEQLHMRALWSWRNITSKQTAVVCSTPPSPPHVHPPPRDDGSPPPRGEPSPSGGSPPGGGGTVHHSRPANSSITQLEIFFSAFGACDFLLISYCSWAK